jgi:hypothetical protein
VCKRGAVRYLGGKRRTFYCDQHGPNRLSDWTRLIPIPVLEYEQAGRVVSIAPPLPPRVARLVDGLVEGLREVIAQDFPATITEDMTRVKAMEETNARLTAEVARLTRELAVAEETANEAMALWPKSPPMAPPAAVKAPPSPEQRTERDFPPPDRKPRPRGPQDVESFPDPAKPEPVPPKPGKGYTITAPPEPTPPEPTPVEKVNHSLRTITEVVDGMDVDLFGLEVLAKQLPAGPGAPGLGITMRALKAFNRLSSHNKRNVLYALAYLGSEHPELLREERIPRAVSNIIGGHIVALRADRRLRIICDKEPGYYHIVDITDRSDKAYWRSER